MDLRHSVRTALGVVGVAALAVAMLAPAGAAAAGKGHGHGYGHAKKAAIQSCKHGGWRELQREDGTRFKNQGRCVSYAAHGHIPAAVVPAVSIGFVPSVTVEGSCDATASVVDFDLAATYAGALVVDAVAAVDPVPVTTDALGDASVALGTFLPAQVLNLTVDGVSSGDVPVDCTVPPPAP